jgi:hypothetical protein
MKAGRGRLTQPVRQAMAGFAALGIVGHLEQATEELHELVADSSLTPAAWRPIEEAFARLLEEARVAAAMVGRGGDETTERIGRSAPFRALARDVRAARSVTGRT